MSNLDKQFENAFSEITQLPTRPDNKHMLALYANYKQATDGDCRGSRPGMLDIAGRAKYDAWKQKKGMAAEEAKRAYVDLVSLLQKG